MVIIPFFEQMSVLEISYTSAPPSSRNCALSFHAKLRRELCSVTQTDQDIPACVLMAAYHFQ